MNHIKTGLEGYAVVQPPLQHRTHNENARVFSHEDRQGRAHFVIDHYSLEKNKYAPWGRGSNTCYGAAGPSKGAVV
jgi:hypothetical protein